MADKKASLIITLKDEVSGALGKIKAAWIGVTAAVAGVTAILVDSFKAFMEQESAVNKLNIALKNQGIVSAAVSRDLQAYAGELQKTTAFSDENILETQALLTTYGLVGNRLKETTKAALDLSAGLGIDLRTATMILGKAAAGETGTLARYGIKISDTIPAGEKLEAVLGQINQRFGGSAQAQLETMAGKMENFKNRVNDLQEKIGAQLVPVLEAWARWAEKLIGLAERLTGAQNADLSVKEIAIKQLTAERDHMVEQARLRAQAHDGVVRMTEAEQERIVMITRQLNVLKQGLEEEKIIEQQKVEAVKGRNLALENEAIEREAKEAEKRAAELLKLDEDTAQILLKHQTRQQMIVTLEQQFGARKALFLSQNLSKEELLQASSHVKRLNELGKFDEARKVEEALTNAAIEENEKKSQAAREELHKMRVANFQSTLSTISTLSSSHIKSLAAIGKAAAIADATISTFQGMNKAWALGPIVGPPLAALVAAAGFANVARISGIQFAHGGMVMPRSGGTQAIIGEAGKREAVIPLDDDRTKEALAETFGSGVTINISAGVIVADRQSVTQFAKSIDEELFRLRRNRESVAFEGI